MRKTLDPAVGPSRTLKLKIPGKKALSFTTLLTLPPPDTTVAFGLTPGTVMPLTSVTRKNAASVAKPPGAGLTAVLRIVICAGVVEPTPRSEERRVGKE